MMDDGGSTIARPTLNAPRLTFGQLFQSRSVFTTAVKRQLLDDACKSMFCRLCYLFPDMKYHIVTPLSTFFTRLWPLVLDIWLSCIALWSHSPEQSWGVVFCFFVLKGIIDIYDGNYILLLYICSQNAAIISLTVTTEEGTRKWLYILKGCPWWYENVVLNNVLSSISSLDHDGRVVSEYRWLTGCLSLDRSGGIQNQNEIKTPRAFGGIKPSGRFFPDFYAAVWFDWISCYIDYFWW